MLVYTVFVLPQDISLDIKGEQEQLARNQAEGYHPTAESLWEQIATTIILASILGSHNNNINK